MSLSLPERLLKKLGVIEPGQINLEQLYQMCNLTLEHCSDMNADAEIVIAPNYHGIITVNSNQNFVRQRFSIAHELGHWYLHKGQANFVCDTTPNLVASDFNKQNGMQTEREADQFAANLLLPPFLLQPLIRPKQDITFDVIKGVADIFRASILATAIQIARLDSHSIVIAVYDSNKKCSSFFRSNMLSDKLWPNECLSTETYANDVSEISPSAKGMVSADEWFANFDLDYDSEVFEESTYWHGNIISIITINEENLLSD